MALAAHDLVPTHVTAVVRSQPLGDRFVRVTFGGGLDRFRWLAPDQFVYVLVPPPGCDELVVGTDFTWSRHEALPEAVRPVGAYYTVRHHRPDAGELDIDVFLHDPAGAASTWASSAAAGSPAALWGPRTAWDPPPGTARWLLVADETGVPAVEAIVEHLPAGADVIEVVAPSPLLVDAVRALDLDPAGLYAWGGAESGAMADVRRHLRHVVGLDRDQVSMTPYWRQA